MGLYGLKTGNHSYLDCNISQANMQLFFNHGGPKGDNQELQRQCNWISLIIAHSIILQKGNTHRFDQDFVYPDLQTHAKLLIAYGLYFTFKGQLNNFAFPCIMPETKEYPLAFMLNYLNTLIKKKYIQINNPEDHWVSSHCPLTTNSKAREVTLHFKPGF